MKRKTNQLKPNKFNESIYGKEQLDESFVRDIKKNGVLVPLSVKRDGTIISGHRRWQTAKSLGIKYVPVAIVKYENEFDEKEALISFNKQREKTFSQRMNEAQTLEVIEKARAIERSKYGKKIDPGAISPTGQKGRTSEKVAEKIGIGKRKTFEQAKKIWEHKNKPGIAKLIKRIDTGEVSINRAFEEVKKAERLKKHIAESKKPQKLKGKYRVIYADPPWDYGSHSGRNRNATRPEDHYSTLTIEQLCKLPVAGITEKNAVLFLWVTSPFLEKSFELINSWGFTYKSSFVWHKNRHVLGNYNSVRHEFVLIATKGSCTPDNNKLFESVQFIKRPSKHSEKPEEFRKIIDNLYSYGNRIELFARKKAKGWQVWGNQV